MPRFGLMSLTLAALGLPLGAVERVPAFVDMRLNLQGVGLSYDVDPSGPGASSTETFDTSVRTDLSWTGCLGVDSWGGVIWGLGLGWGYNNESESGASLTLNTYTVDGFIGYVFAFSESLQIEVAPFVGAGRAHLRFTNPTSKDHATILEYGVRASVLWTHHSGFQAGLTGGLLNFHTEIEPEQDGVGIGTRFDFDVNAPFVGAFIGVRL